MRKEKLSRPGTSERGPFRRLAGIALEMIRQNRTRGVRCARVRALFPQARDQRVWTQQTSRGDGRAVEDMRRLTGASASPSFGPQRRFAVELGPGAMASSGFGSGSS